MTINNPLYPPLIGPGGVPNVVPFTIRENPTQMYIVESMRAWITNQLVPFINDNINQLSDDWVSQVTELIEAWETLSVQLVAQVQDIADSASTDAADADAARIAAEEARDLAQQYASDAEEIQDTAIAGIVADNVSDTRVELDSIYATITALNTVSGTLSTLVTDVSNLSDDVEDNSTVIDEGRLSETVMSTRYAVRKVHIFLLGGQSNMSGRGTPFTNITDPQNPRIYEYGSKVRSLRLASDPLDMHDTASGVSPGMQAARRILGVLGADDVVVLVPGAHGGTALSGTGSMSWRWGVSGNLSAALAEQYSEAVLAAVAEWPNAEIVPAGFFWHQGEGDSATSPATYRADYENLIAGFRSHTGNPDLPFIGGEMVPEGVASTPGRAEIQFVQASTVDTTKNVGFASGPGFGYSADNLHYDILGVRKLGISYADEWLRIRGGAFRANALSYPSGMTIWSDNFNDGSGTFNGREVEALFGEYAWVASSSANISAGEVTITNAAGAYRSCVVTGENLYGTIEVEYRGSTGNAWSGVTGWYNGSSEFVHAGINAISNEARVAVVAPGGSTIIDTVPYTPAIGDVLSLTLTQGHAVFKINDNVLIDEDITAMETMRYGFNSVGGSSTSTFDNVTFRAL